MRDSALSMAKRAKTFGCTVIVCSSDAHDQYEKYFPSGVDYVIRGEGEETLRELLDTLERRGDVSQVHGLVFKKAGVTVVNNDRPVMRELDQLPMPAWDLVDINAYKRIWKKHHGYFSINVATTRGCPFKCNWCAKPIYGNRYNSRSPEHVIKEIEYLKATFQPDHIWFCDDIFGLKPQWIQQFRNLVQERGIQIRYKIQSRADLLLVEDTIAALAQSGAETVWIGAESGSQKILDAMEKGTTVHQIGEASKLLRKNGIKVAFFLQFGYLGETKHDIDATIAMVLELMPDEVGISVSYPLPGTKFYENVRHQLKDKSNWTDSDDLDMMFQSSFNNAYYRQLHRYVHSIYRKEKGYHTWKKLFVSPLRLSLKELKAGLATIYYLPTSFAQRRKLRRFEASSVDPKDPIRVI